MYYCHWQVAMTKSLDLDSWTSIALTWTSWTSIALPWTSWTSITLPWTSSNDWRIVEGSPLHLWFALTLNKLQGQSFTYVGVDLRMPPFTHGQLYVALSRATDIANLSLLLLPNNTEHHISRGVAPVLDIIALIATVRLAWLHYRKNSRNRNLT